MKRMIALLLAAAMLAACFAAFAEEEAADTRHTGLQVLDISEAFFSGNQMTTSIIAEPFYEGVTDEESAEQAITAVYDRLGANENTQLMLDSVYGTEGLTYRLIQEYIPETGRVSIFRSMPMNKSG